MLDVFAHCTKMLITGIVNYSEVKYIILVLSGVNISLNSSEQNARELYFSQKQLPRKMMSRLVIIECAGYIFWQLFLWPLQLSYLPSLVTTPSVMWFISVLVI